MRLLHLPNELSSTDPAKMELSARNAFKHLHLKGSISHLHTYSYIERLNKNPDYGAFRAELLSEIEAFKPDIIFVQHVTRRPLDKDLWRDALKRAPMATLAYQDGDAYGRLVKKIDEPMRHILGASHLNFVVSLGYVADQFSKLSNGKVFYMPHCFDKMRFPIAPPNTEKKYDIIAVGNAWRRARLKFLFLPGGRTRYKLFKALSQAYGERFALHGAGWEKLRSSKGPLPYLEQHDAVREARVSVHWNNFPHLPYYFSDRVPIFLAAGVPHVTSYQPGYEHIFSGCRGFYTGKTPKEVAECVSWLLSRPDEHLWEEGLAAQQWVKDNLEADIVYARAFAQCRDVHLERQSKR
ncbi:hypothetical protein ABLE91_06590 [Aquabacter sp. CN5-332]|uniref:glycosyltransferase family protein n=1 Tax=Aquabacter sp. CN5-332 TaxID=3156608 RepID=UPI0032B4B10F